MGEKENPSSKPMKENSEEEKIMKGPYYSDCFI